MVYTERMKTVLLSIVVGMMLLPGLCPAQEQRDVLFAGSMVRAIRIIAKEHFTPATEAELTTWAIHGLFDAVKKPIPASIKERLSKLDKAKSDEIGALLRDARAHLGQPMELAERRDLKICIEAISRNLEPAATPEQRLGLHELNGRPAIFRFALRGVGLKLEVDPKTKMLRVVTPIYNSPAHLAGIRSGDIITSIRHDSDINGKQLVGPDNDGNDAPMPRIYSTKGMSVEEANRLLLGKAGTRVTLIVIPAQRDKK